MANVEGGKVRYGREIGIYHNIKATNDIESLGLFEAIFRVENHNIYEITLDKPRTRAILFNHTSVLR